MKTKLNHGAVLALMLIILGFTGCIDTDSSSDDKGEARVANLCSGGCQTVQATRAQFMEAYPDGMTYFVQFNNAGTWTRICGADRNTAVSGVNLGRSVTVPEFAAYNFFIPEGGYRSEVNICRNTVSLQEAANMYNRYGR